MSKLFQAFAICFFFVLANPAFASRIPPLSLLHLAVHNLTLESIEHTKKMRNAGTVSSKFLTEETKRIDALKKTILNILDEDQKRLQTFASSVDVPSDINEFFTWSANYIIIKKDDVVAQSYGDLQKTIERAFIVANKITPKSWFLRRMSKQTRTKLVSNRVHGWLDHFSYWVWKDTHLKKLITSVAESDPVAKDLSKVAQVKWFMQIYYNALIHNSTSFLNERLNVCTIALHRS